MKVGVFIRVRGWLECDARRAEKVREIVLRSENDHYYSTGWTFPEGVRSWTSYVFYGHDIREAALPWFIGLLRDIAPVQASDDEDDLIVGYFLASHEVDGMTEMFVRDGTVSTMPAREGIAYLDM